MRATRAWLQSATCTGDVAVPDMAADEVLIKVTAAGMCRTDAQLVDGYFKDYHPPDYSVQCVRFVLMRLSRLSPMKVLSAQGVHSLQSASSASN